MDRRAGTVLVVEDEPPIRNLLQDGLSGEGYAVETASNGREALALLEHDGIDVVLLDVMLPGMSGLELARLISERCPTFIIAMSASTDMLARAAESPFVDKALAKPFEWETLINHLQMAVA